MHLLLIGLAFGVIIGAAGMAWIELGDNSKRKILTRAEALQIRKLCDTTQLTHGEIGKAFDVTDTVVQRISKMRVK